MKHELKSGFVLRVYLSILFPVFIWYFILFDRPDVLTSSYLFVVSIALLLTAFVLFGLVVVLLHPRTIITEESGLLFHGIINKKCEILWKDIKQINFNKSGYGTSVKIELKNAKKHITILDKITDFQEFQHLLIRQQEKHSYLVMDVGQR